MKKRKAKIKSIVSLCCLWGLLLNCLGGCGPQQTKPPASDDALDSSLSPSLSSSQTPTSPGVPSTQPSQPADQAADPAPDRTDVRVYPYLLLDMSAEKIAEEYGPMTFVTTWWGGSAEYRLEGLDGVSVLFGIAGFYELGEFPYYMTPYIVMLTGTQTVYPGIGPGMRHDEISDSIVYTEGWRTSSAEAGSGCLIRTFETESYTVDVYYQKPLYINDYYFNSTDGFTGKKEAEYKAWADRYMTHMQNAQISMLRIYKTTPRKAEQSS